ncbi:MAG: GTPase [Thermoguttaceae bacterium]
MFSLDDTIAAIASPPGGAARGIVRISGPRAMECLASVWGGTENLVGGADILVCQSEQDCGRQECLPHRQEYVPHRQECLPLVWQLHCHPRAAAASLHLADVHSPIPCDVYCWPRRGYTGQPVVEIHTIGSPPLLQMVLRAVCAAGARLAAAGEFTLRAFLAGRIDLTQAEAVLGVIDADSPTALDAALGQLAGGLARPLHRLRDDLLDLLADLEAGFDFTDEDLPFIAREQLDCRLADAENQVAAVERQMDSRSETVDMVQAVLLGRPNTGKSSLFNALAGKSAALVSHQPGTTRDYLTAELDLDGVKCRLIDTAGLPQPLAVSHAEGTIERAAQLATDSQRRSSHVHVFCLDSTRPLDDWERCELQREPAGEQRIVVLTKCDAPQVIEVVAAAIATSSRTGEGVQALRDQLRRKALAVADAHGGVVAATAARCRESLRLAAQSLRQARSIAVAGQEELAAAEIRVALDELGKVVGAIYTDDVLDRIFSRFCIGK